MPASPRDKSGGRYSAQAVQRSASGEKRDTQGLQTCCVGQLRHTAHWLASDENDENEGNDSGRLMRGVSKRLNTLSIYSCCLS